MEETWLGLDKAPDEVREEILGQESPVIRRDHSITALRYELKKFETKWRELCTMSR